MTSATSESIKILRLLQAEDKTLDVSAFQETEECLREWAEELQRSAGLYAQHPDQKKTRFC